MQNPFDSIESAHQYVALLEQQVREVDTSIAIEIETAANPPGRHLDALRLVAYKLGQLETHLVSSRRLLNDLRVLRRLLLGERDEAPSSAPATRRLASDDEDTASHVA